MGGQPGGGAWAEETSKRGDKQVLRENRSASTDTGIRALQGEPICTTEGRICHRTYFIRPKQTPNEGKENVFPEKAESVLHR